MCLLENCGRTLCVYASPGEMQRPALLSDPSMLRIVKSRSPAGALRYFESNLETGDYYAKGDERGMGVWGELGWTRRRSDRRRDRIGTVRFLNAKTVWKFHCRVS